MLLLVLWISNGNNIYFYEGQSGTTAKSARILREEKLQRQLDCFSVTTSQSTSETSEPLFGTLLSVDSPAILLSAVAITICIVQVVVCTYMITVEFFESFALFLSGKIL